MSELSELYQQVILDHNRNPRNNRGLEAPDAHAEGYNPLCGDRLTVFLRIQDGVIEDVAFQGSGCAISKASASMMTQGVRGKRADEARHMGEEFRKMAMGDPQAHPEDLGKLAIFAGVSEFPARVKCATLAWHTLQAALEHRVETVSTEEGTET